MLILRTKVNRIIRFFETSQVIPDVPMFPAPKTYSRNHVPPHALGHSGQFSQHSNVQGISSFWFPLSYLIKSLLLLLHLLHYVTTIYTRNSKHPKICIKYMVIALFWSNPRLEMCPWTICKSYYAPNCHLVADFFFSSKSWMALERISYRMRVDVHVRSVLCRYGLVRIFIIRDEQ